MLKHNFDIQIDPRLDGEPRCWVMRADSGRTEGWHGRVLFLRWFWERESKPLRG